MFCPNNETLQNLTEKTKLLAQKCSQQIRISTDYQQQQEVTTFKSYLNETTNFEIEASPTSPIKCITANLTSLNRLIKERCSFTSYTCNTLPRCRPKKGTTKWYIKVSVEAS